MKPIALAASVLGILGCILFALRDGSMKSPPFFFALTAIVLNGVLILLWIFLFKPNPSVHLPAQAYAERLVGSLDTM